MTSAVSTHERTVIDLLLHEWRMIETVALTPSSGGQGFEATIMLNRALVAAAIEQQGLCSAPSTLATAEARRKRAIAECVESVNAKLPPSSRIRNFRLIG